MKGKVLDYSIQEGKGVISADDGNRYEFASSQWKSKDAHPAKNVQVDFVIEDDKAQSIYVLHHQTTVNKYDESNLAVPQQTSAAAIVSMIFGILGLFLDWWFFAIPSLIAVITGHVARSNIKKSQGRMGGDGFAVAGLILGYIILILYLLVAVFFVGLFASLATMK